MKAIGRGKECETAWFLPFNMMLYIGQAQMLIEAN